MTDLVALKAANAKRWADAKVTRNFASVARALVATKARYQAVQKLTGIPWEVIAVIHEREASQLWDAQLGQGDPLNAISVHVPKGRGPFKTWEDGAVDALTKCRPFAAANRDWSIGGILTVLEQYNGLGYANRQLPSPYIWSGTDQYKSGKYIRDGVYDSQVIDVQLGCAGLLLAMAALDRTMVDKPPSLPQPKQSGWAAFFAFILSLFRRK